MSQLQALTNAVREVVIGGQTLPMRRLTLRQSGELEQWLRQQIIRNGMAAIRELDLPLRERRQEHQEIMRAAAMISLDSEEAQGLLESIYGAIKLLHLTCSQSGMSIDQMSALCEADTDGMRAALNEFRRMSSEGMPPPDEQAPKGQAAPPPPPVPGPSSSSA